MTQKVLYRIAKRDIIGFLISTFFNYTVVNRMVTLPYSSILGFNLDTNYLPMSSLTEGKKSLPPLYARKHTNIS